MKTDNRLKSLFVAGVAVGGMAALCVYAVPVYEVKDADVGQAAVMCRTVGVEVVAEDLFACKDFWKLRIHGDRLKIEADSVQGGVKGLCLSGSDKKCDTAWSATSGRIPIKGVGRRYRLGFRVNTTVQIKIPNYLDGEGWRSAIFWHDTDGKEISKTYISYFAPKGQGTDVAMHGDIPEGVASFSIRLGFDWPNIGPGDKVEFSRLSFEELPDSPAFAREAWFVSEVRKGGRISWEADVPAGCAICFQWRGAESASALVGRSFRGPDGTDGSFYKEPFVAKSLAVQYRALLVSNGKATPALREVSGGGWTDRDWTVAGDVRPPYVRRVSPSPTRNAFAALRIEVGDATSMVLWDSLKVSVDGKDRTAAFVRNGNVISLNAPSGGWAPGLHTSEISVVDFHGNRANSWKTFYIGDAPTTPKVSLRDDGMTLIDGSPFFPIGMYAVCKREFNGNSLDVAFKGLKDAGFNMAHTYGNSYDPEFLAAASKYRMKLWVEGRHSIRNLIDIGRHNPNIIAWYIGDDTSDHMSPEQEADYDEWVKSVDPTRITVQADPIFLWHGAASRYADYVTATDGFMPEIYPVRDASAVRTCVAATVRDMKQFREDVRLHGGGRPRTCWAIIQYFKGWGWNLFPTRDQLFAMTWAAVIHGAHGVIWYTYGGFYDEKRKSYNEGVTSSPERWQAMSELATQLQQLTPVLVERMPREQPKVEILSGPEKDPLGENPSVTVLLKRHAGKNFLFMVNASTEPVKAKVTMPDGGVTEWKLPPFGVRIP